MENSPDLTQFIDQGRWLLNNGLVSDAVKNQLFFCGSIAHKDVQAVEVHINPEQKVVDYILYVPTNLLRKIDKYRYLSKSTTLWGMWRFKRLLKKERCLDFQKILNTFVTDYCGPKWTAFVTVLDYNMYEDEIDVGDEVSTGKDLIPD